MTKQQKIDAIYEKIARKDLNFGCKVKVSEENIGNGTFYGEYPSYVNCTLLHRGKYMNGAESEFKIKNVCYFGGNLHVSEFSDEQLIIIGNPIMIGDVMDYVEHLPPEKIVKLILGDNRIFELWKHKRKPIEEQSDECVDFVYSLISG